MRFWGVESPAAVEVPGFGDVTRPVFSFAMGGKKIELYRHPELFISEEVRAWYREYRWMENTVCTVQYNDSNPLFHSAAALYENYNRRPQ